MCRLYHLGERQRRTRGGRGNTTRKRTRKNKTYKRYKTKQEQEQNAEGRKSTENQPAMDENTGKKENHAKKWSLSICCALGGKRRDILHIAISRFLQPREDKESEQRKRSMCRANRIPIRIHSPSYSSSPLVRPLVSIPYDRSPFYFSVSFSVIVASHSLFCFSSTFLSLSERSCRLLYAYTGLVFTRRSWLIKKKRQLDLTFHAKDFSVQRKRVSYFFLN